MQGLGQDTLECNYALYLPIIKYFYRPSFTP